MNYNDELVLNEIPGYNAQNIKTVLETMNQFVSDGLGGLGIDFYVFDWNNDQLIGLFLGMIVKLKAVTSSAGLQTVFEYATTIANNYNNNPYHSFYHAADVAYMVYYFLEDMAIADQMDMTLSNKIALLLSALGHDVLHPGTNNLYQVNAKTPVAIKYKDISVLEYQSADFVKDLLENSNLLAELQFEESFNETFKRKLIDKIYDSIIKTDMCYHFSLLNQLGEICDSQCENANFTTNVRKSTQSLAVSGRSVSFTQKSTQKNTHESLNNPFRNSVANFLQKQGQPLAGESSDSLNSVVISPPKLVFKSENEPNNIFNIILHAADISNPIRPFINCKKWSDLVMNEFELQGKLEIEAGLPLSPNMGPDAIKLQSQIQLAFTQFIVQPFFEYFQDIFPKFHYLAEIIMENVTNWGGTNLNPKRRLGKKWSQGLQSKIRGRKLSSAAGTIEIPEKLGGSRKWSIEKSEVEKSEDLHIPDEVEEEEEPGSIENLRI